MEKNEMSQAALEPFPPYAGVDNDNSGAGMYSEPSEPVVSVMSLDPSSVTATHPFQISVAEDGNTWSATVGAGNGFLMVLYKDSFDVVMPSMGVLTFAEQTFEDLADDTSYGIWIRWTVDWDSIDPKEKPAGFGDTFGTPVIGSGTIVKSDAYVEQSQLAAATLATQGFAYMHIGKIAIANGAVTVTASVTENVTLTVPTVLMAAALLSSQEGNVLSLGTDSLPYYGGPGAYLTEGDGISLSTDEFGYVTISNSGVLSASAGTGTGSVSPSTGNITINFGP